MRKRESTTAWVVYSTPASGKDGTTTSVCSQEEWEAKERERPGEHTLIRANIPTEAEAERVARDASGYVEPSRAGGQAKPKT